MGMGLEQEVLIHLMVLWELRAPCFPGPAPRMFILPAACWNHTCRCSHTTTECHTTETEAQGMGMSIASLSGLMWLDFVFECQGKSLSRPSRPEGSTFWKSGEDLSEGVGLGHRGWETCSDIYHMHSQNWSGDCNGHP